MSSVSSEVSNASSNANGEPKHRQRNALTTRQAVKHVLQSAHTQDVVLFLIAFRILNALTVQTFFQPDEYFQSLEPAWQLAFGRGSGAWITWEWKHHLRSALHPAVFAAAYKASDFLSNILKLSPATRADLLLATPKTLQAFLAALGDYYTWKLAELAYGRGTVKAWATLALTTASPWQWFCSTRTFSNCLESTLTVIALFNWPWHWSISNGRTEDLHVDKDGLRVRSTDKTGHGGVDETTRLRRALLYAAVATVLRPTNVLIWIVLILSMSVKTSKSKSSVQNIGTESSLLQRLTSWSIALNTKERYAFLREAILCGSIILTLSALVDRSFYQVWTFPPLNFIHINVVQSLAIFYGNNDWHYYLSQGYPLLLTTALPFTIIGLYRGLKMAFSTNQSATSKVVTCQLAIVSLLLPAALSLISHKEVRFIYPLLPALHILSAGPLADFFGPAVSQSITHPKLSPPYRRSKRFLLTIFLMTNFIVALYTTTIHNSGLIEITHYLRGELETHYLEHSRSNRATNLTAGFLMPCHSTPWRSHLQYPPNSPILPSISAWALTCEPPLGLSPTEKAAYLDEADLFYANPSLWLKENMSRHAPLSFKNRRGVFAAEPGRRRIETHANSGALGTQHAWPEYLVFFEQLEGVLQTILQGSGYVECARLFNSQWHDDRRRTGDIVVWCLYAERARSHQPGNFAVKGAALWKRMWASERGRELDEILQETKAALKQMRVGIGRIYRGIRGQLDVPDGPRRTTPLSKMGSVQVINAHDIIDGLVERVAEKPFWKQRSKDGESAAEGDSWWRSIPGLGPAKKKKSWWDGGLWS